MPIIYERKCDWCRSDYRGRGSKFCGNKCATKFKHKNIEFGFKKGVASWNKYLEPKRCKTCNLDFKPKTREQVYCSRKCYSESIKERYKLSKHPRWNNGKTKNSAGYIMVTIGKGKQVYEHRFVMEKHLKRKLDVDEHVHHVNGNKSDNRAKNLIVLSHSEHNRLHMIRNWQSGGSFRNK